MADPSRAGVTPPGSGPQPEERHRREDLVDELWLLPREKWSTFFTGAMGLLARFEAEVRGEEREACASAAEALFIEDIPANPYEVLRAVLAALRGGGSRSEEGGA